MSITLGQGTVAASNPRSPLRWGRAAAFAVLAVACSRPAANVPAPHASAPSRGVEQAPWIRPDAAKIRAAGGSEPLVVAFGAGAPGDNLGGRVDIPTDACAVFLARGSTSIEDLDLFVYADDGTVLGADESGNAGATAVVCPPHPLHVYAFGRIAAGHGLFAVAAQRVPPADATRAASAVGATAVLRETPLAGPPGEGGVRTEGTVWPGLEESLAQHRRDLGGRFRDVRRVAVPMDPRIPTRVSASVDPGQCVDALVLAADEVAYIELTALDGDGRILGRAPAEGRAPALVACVKERATVTFELRSRAGRGLAAMILSVTDDAASVDASSGMVLRDGSDVPPLDEGQAALAARLSRKGYSAPLRSERANTVIGQRVSRVLPLPEGCSRIDVLAGAPSRTIEAWLWADNGALLAHDDGGSAAVLFACGPARSVHLDVEAIVRAGPFAVDVRSGGSAPAALLQHPLAASRLLGRLSGSGRLSSPGEAGPVRAVAASSGARASEDTVIPAGHCVDAVFALGAGAEGAEVELVDLGSNQSLGVVRGTYSAVAEACALPGGRPLTVRAQLRAVAGAADALFAFHPRALSTAPQVKVTEGR